MRLRGGGGGGGGGERERKGDLGSKVGERRLGKGWGCNMRAVRLLLTR